MLGWGTGLDPAPRGAAFPSPLPLLQRNPLCPQTHPPGSLGINRHWDIGDPPLTTFWLLSSSSSTGGMVMERSGGFLLCRRLLLVLDRLPPFLSLDDISNRRSYSG